jgi:hypothetical protein
MAYAMQHLLPFRFRGWAAAVATGLWVVAATAGEGTPPTAPDTHWAFAPLSRAEPPRPRAAAWARTVPDLWVLEGLERAGLEPSPEADRISWLRRVHFDLTGLPPTPEAVEAFGRDSRPDAHERVVEALLQSPAHGERWGQHWLDVVRYADTHGFEVNTERPHAWPYRDYVIRAFNADTPFPEFIREQLAGDQIGRDAATGFLVTASVLLPGQIGADDVSKRLARQDALDEIVVNTSQAFLGLTVGCARCHDHKFDPVSSRDYFGMQAFFAGVEYGDRELKDPESEARREDIRRWKQRKALVESELSRIEPEARPASPSGSAPGRPAVRARGNSDRFPPVTTRRVRFTVLETNSLEPCIDELEVWDPEARNVALATTGTTVRSSGDTTVENRHELRFIHDGVHGNAHSWMSNEKGRGWVILEFPEPRRIDRVTWARDREGEFSDRLATAYRIEVGTDSGGWVTVADATDRKPFKGGNPASEDGEVMLSGLQPRIRERALALIEERRALERAIAGAVASQQAFAGLFRKPDRIHLLRRGDPEQPGPEVPPAVPEALGNLRLPAEAPEAQRRRALAEWLARPDQALVARVTVNRVWQGHFGIGLVDTPNDFGRMGSRPSHPGLLDWLAREFAEQGGSLKQLHRRIVLSSTYRQSSAHRRDAAARDADGRLLWRYPPRRLDSEPIRDAMLAVSGELQRQRGGRGFDLFDQRGGLSGFKPVESFPPDGLRRMIYAHKVRREPEAVFGAFDCPDAGQSTARRRESTTPIQALNLWNSRFTLERAAAFARRVSLEVGNDRHEQVRRAFLLALSRPATRDEELEAVEAVRGHGLEALCRALLNSNEFLFIP